MAEEIFMMLLSCLSEVVTLGVLALARAQAAAHPRWALPGQKQACSVSTFGAAVA